MGFDTGVERSNLNSFDFRFRDVVWSHDTYKIKIDGLWNFIGRKLWKPMLHIKVKGFNYDF